MIKAQEFDLDGFFNGDLKNLPWQEQFDQILFQANENYDVDMNASLVLIDSLRSYAGRFELDHDQRLNFDIVLADVLTAYGDLDGAKEHITRLRQSLNTLDVEGVDRKSEMNAYESLGKHAFAHSQMDSALYFFSQQLAIALSQSDTAIVMNSYNNVGLTYETMGIYDLAIENLIQSALLSEQLGLKKQIVSSYNNLGLAYQENGDYDSGHEYLMKAVALIDEIGWESENGYAYGNLAYNRFYVGDYKTARDYAHRSEQAFTQFGFEAELGLLNAIMGRIYIKLGEVDQGQKYLQKALEMASPTEFVEVYVEIMFGKAEAAGVMGNQKEAERRLLESVQVAHDHDLHKLRLTALEFLVAHYEQTRAYERAFETQTVMTGLRDSIFNVRKNFQISDLQTRYETAKKDEEILQGNLDLERQKSRTNTIVIVLILATLLIVLMVYFYLQIRKSRRRLNRQKDQLAELNQTKDKFFSIIAHDLRSPMIGLQGVGQKLEYFIRKNKQEKLLEVGTQVDQSIDQLNHLLNNLLNWAASQVGGIPHHPETIDLRELILENIKLYQSLAQSKDIRLLCEMNGLSAYADANATATVIRNLLSNAIKFTREGGEITINGTRNGGFSVVTITDQGPGMDAESARSIFDRSIRSTRGTSGEQGFGLGLSLCKEFLEKNHGNMEVTAAPGAGSTFTVSLPASVKDLVGKPEITYKTSAAVL